MKISIISILMLTSSLIMNVYSQTVMLDETFGQNGTAIIPNTSEIRFFDFDSHGNIIAVGYSSMDRGKYHLTIAKTSADGIVDESFGNGGLVKVTDYDYSRLLGLKITSENKIVVIGGFAKVQFEGRETLIMQFNEDGSIDESFGDNGKVNLNFNAGNILSLNLENDDFILLGRRSETIDNNGNIISTFIGNTISKYNYNGLLDESFGENGKTLLTKVYQMDETFDIHPYCIKILNDGSFCIAGYGYGRRSDNPPEYNGLAF